MAIKVSKTTKSSKASTPVKSAKSASAGKASGKSTKPVSKSAKSSVLSKAAVKPTTSRAQTKSTTKPENKLVKSTKSTLSVQASKPAKTLTKPMQPVREIKPIEKNNVSKLGKKEMAHFKDILTERRTILLRQAEDTYGRGLVVKAEELPDEVDLAAAEAEQSMDLLLRDRERILLRKIDKALRKFDTNDYGVCEECGDMISVQRLEARPVAEYCIHCKEDMEQVEKSFAD